MLQTNLLNSPVRHIVARVELYNNSTLVNTFRHNDKLISATIERIGDESKFFGYGICQKLNVKLLDADRELDINTSNTLKVYFDDTDTHPAFKVSEVHRDENTNALSITAYDYLYQAANHRLSEIDIAGYTILELAAKCAILLNLTCELKNVNDNAFSVSYENGANFDGTENLREVLDDIAEATQTIYYVDNSNNLIFRRLSQTDVDFRIDRNLYYTLDCGTNKRLIKICHATELGDNVEIAYNTQSGSTQFVRDNAFYELRDDIADLLDTAIAAIGGLTINQFDCHWRGHYGLEIGDRLEFETKDNDVQYSFLLNDTLTYNGAFEQRTKWKYNASDVETAANPASLGDALKQTYARVDKANKEIELVASSIEDNDTKISALEINTESIMASVRQVETNTTNQINGINENIDKLTKQVEAKVSAEQIEILVQKEMQDGVNSITTNTGYTFNDEGLTVSKSNSEMETVISEDGMTVYKNGNAVLVANNAGVDAINLHATTYLIIGTNSRFEDYDNGSRTGCFWIGG